MRSPAAAILYVCSFDIHLHFVFPESERGREREGGYAVRPNKVLFSTFHKIKRFGNVYKPDKIEAVLNPKIPYTTTLK